MWGNQTELGEKVLSWKQTNKKNPNPEWSHPMSLPLPHAWGVSICITQTTRYDIKGLFSGKTEGPQIESLQGPH